MITTFSSVDSFVLLAISYDCTVLSTSNNQAFLYLQTQWHLLPIAGHLLSTLAATADKDTPSLWQFSEALDADSAGSISDADAGDEDDAKTQPPVDDSMSGGDEQTLVLASAEDVELDMGGDVSYDEYHLEECDSEDKEGPLDAFGGNMDSESSQMMCLYLHWNLELLI
ncbi:hypothetical protein NEOLEDRAFT_1140028 [Neolentinus lepideus HHB14362 ss-1]|uniref:Uncharacterized protein n=1 Tax=Neolentinus lepideus HHB14362 ss-1 TaxID=1314782 RepID=A0A165PGB6_9AGAM|nr:hypothetical protein NEOLEDRAFT_1140028 [Neolentinus lepideus HHB14362 ss-1]